MIIYSYVLMDFQIKLLSSLRGKYSRSLLYLQSRLMEITIYLQRGKSHYH